MAFKMKYKNLEEIVKQLHGASKMHKQQAKKLDKHIDEMESPMNLKSSGSVSWKYGDSTYHGTLIPSKETSTHRYARTHNNKIKSLPK